MTQIIWIGLAGAFGAISRYSIGVAAGRVFGAAFPYGTLIANVLGCALIGFLMHVGLATDWLGRETRTVLTTGFLGALTTFSTFSYETVTYMEDGAWWLAAGNVGINLVLGIAATLGGLMLGRAITGGA